MGMPGSSEYLEELLSRVLGDFIQEGFVCKIADDLYIDGDTIADDLYIDGHTIADDLYIDGYTIADDLYIDGYTIADDLYIGGGR